MHTMQHAHINAFHGGVHPSEGKIARKSAVEAIPLQDRYIVPLQMHIGAPAHAVVNVGDHVLRGQLLAEGSGFVSAPVHSPTSGLVKAITTCLGVNGSQLPALVIESDGNDTPCEPMAPITDWREADPAVLRQRIGNAGIVGMGGASFPTLVKLSPPQGRVIDTLILNGVECEPCLTADHRLMLESPEMVIEGALIVGRILGVKRIVLAIEANKRDAIELLTVKAAGMGIEVMSLKVRYPQGAEKQLIYSVTGRTVPAGKLPADVGCVVQNVGSTAACGEAVCYGKPLYERILTMTGTPVVHPSNYLVRVGTTYEMVLRHAGGIKPDVSVAKIISGGPMMGFCVYSLEIPVMKNTSGILLLADEELTQYTSYACIRCGHCNDACPMELQPSILSAHIEHGQFELAKKWHVMNCVECGCCAYVCPAGRPLVQHIRRAKAFVNAEVRAVAAAAKAQKS